MCMCSDARRLGSFGYKIQAPEPCIEIVTQLQRIFTHPTGQGAALQTNHPPSISLPDWQPGIWLKTKSVNNNRVCKMHILNMEKPSLHLHISHLSIWECVLYHQSFVGLFHLHLRCQGLVEYGGVKGGLTEGAKHLPGVLRCNLTSEKFCQLLNQRCIVPERMDGCWLKEKMGRVRGIKRRIWETFDRLRVLCLHNKPSSTSGVLRLHATVLIPPMNMSNCSSAIIWVLDKTAWSTLVTLEIRIREISWQAIWKQSNQVSRDSVGRPKAERAHAVSSAVLLSTRWMANCHSRCAQNPSELEVERHPETKSLSHSEGWTARWWREYRDNCNQAGASFHYVLRYRP